MMQVMIYRGVDPFTKPILVKTFWVDLVSRMTVHIINNRKQKENWQMKTVYGNCKKENCCNSNLYNSFQRMKCISGPRRRINRLVMYKMKYLKNFWMMHYPVCPIEIGVIHDEHQRKCRKKIEPAILFDLCIMRRVWFNVWVLDKKERNKSKYQHCDN